MTDYGAVEVKCPFYKEETKNSIKCEGIFGLSCMHTFESKSAKTDHKKAFCNCFNFKKCALYQSVNSTYKKHPTETPGTFAEDTLMKCGQT